MLPSKLTLLEAWLKVLYDGDNGTAVCEFTNLVMFEGRLIYIYNGDG